ncbi:sulfatase-like hydrolase/transferase [Sinorhizobium terangae]|uniref:Sulfatase-like hydrolase/transferase n=1 Tax=Sinorhizobium terangae TaxID=110322 RepID=A0A6N7LBZ8_SINTE|nr:sulfatase-like hydrolase/transferase [Sinorhizobium terangae]MQX14729.1 sulfatase-like hydrolase/transferase [Sinorhizobium terangae]WFU51596.1 sulfatase-like hydrolase/transferase [Sinorhizobium terangae]
MNAVFVLFDSLNRHVLAPYRGQRVPTPNFSRLAGRAATFERHYVGSLPCMPARRDLQTGRLSFLHRSWGPLEPFDNSFPELLREAGCYSHLVTDHFHYFEDGGATYHTRYDSYDFIRGQEGDPWKAMVQPPWERLRQMYHERQFSQSARDKFRRNIVNREFIKEESDFPSMQCFAAGLEFIERNRTADNWLLQIETFDPHEPFTAPERFREAFTTGWNGPIRDWPRYGRVDELPEECEELRANYYALVALCDFLIGQLLDYFDQHDLWRDTALVVTTDHGFLLGEHDFWAKNRMNMYEEIVHIPLFAYDPRRPGSAGVRRSALTQTIDLAPTFLDLFGVPAVAEMEGHSLLPLFDADRSLRRGALFGYFGGAINATDGRYTYHRFPPDPRSQELYQYTLMPTHIWEPFTPEELAGASLQQPLPFTKGAPVLKVPVIERSPMYDNYGPGALLESETRLYDLANDPGQNTPLVSPEIEGAMTRLMQDLMRANDAPPEAYARVGIEAE